MGLFICSDCGKQVSDQAKSCPNCGRPIEFLTNEPFCKVCNRKGNQVELVPTTIKKVPGGANLVASILFILGIIGLFVYFSGIILILISILIWSLGKKEYRILRCPQCRAVRELE